ncbi:hypothetical protein K6L05_00290 [Salinicoccus roseus]|uniref:hypothetical protein n=1 Tax=Salinicoccus roseus TaxID=45670 RepID=UPI001CA78935|nr:hypothetical protein [Salinicoccus roseus]MBY8908222.1 hypothetical protein [Salinicoccus roseus]
MKLYRVRIKEFETDEDLAVYVISSSKKSALEITLQENKYNWETHPSVRQKNFEKNLHYWCFNECFKNDLIVEEIKFDSPKVIAVHSTLK